MFIILFGLQFAVRAVIAWIWRVEDHHGNRQDDLECPGGHLDLNVSANKYDTPDGGGMFPSPQQVKGQGRVNNSSREWGNSLNNYAGRRNFDHVHKEWNGYTPRKRVFHENENNSGIDDIVVPAKVAHLSSSPVVTEDAEKTFDVENVHGYWDMPFLSNNSTVAFIKGSHTMIIMRGLPGSGKSTLVKCIKSIYKDSVTICSADNFFLDKEGNYNFDASKLSDAHKFCQDKAAYHCDKGTRVVVIDNTNIQRWEMSYYVRLAQNSHYYHVIILEPQTPWRYEPTELARRNKHKVPAGIIHKKLQSLTDHVYRPLYYGWFLCKDDSAMLVKKSREALRNCVVELTQSGLESKDLEALEDILNSLVISYTDPVPMLHCTAAYLARRSKDPYHTREAVTEAMGRSFRLYISGFVYSKRSLSAQVILKPNIVGSVPRGASSASEKVVSSVVTKSKSNSDGDIVNQVDLSKISITESSDIIQADLYVKDEEERLRDKYKDVHVHTHDSDEKHALFQHGCSAHITISYANDGQSKQSGDDIINILELQFYGKVKQKEISLGLLSIYGQDMYQIKLKEAFKVNTLFQGFYSGRG